ncbi:hypothetical protein KR074_004655 [Drosophila pseudoananassae]|nr:hypothetical protein KR074_004655 [Drosophila pseudoananassae]
MEPKKLSAVHIAVREAPFRQFLGRREPSVVQFPPWGDGKSLVVDQNEYNFDHAFKSNSSQEQLYDTLIQPLVEKVLQGYPCTALAYGQTGTGKSYSMGMAPPKNILQPEQIGILPRCLNDILARLNSQQENFKVPIKVSASFIEIYNEKAYDLLSSSPHVPMVPSRCQSCTSLILTSQDDLQRLLQLGTGNRKVRATPMNANSSRSHAIVTIHVRNGSQHSRMNIVDLAGSEGVRRTAHEGVARQEGVNINRGLLSITKVIMSMGAGHSLIPYRDSVLTTVLQGEWNGLYGLHFLLERCLLVAESLTAKSYVTFLACISPHAADLSETVATLRFATSAKKLRLNPQQLQRKQSVTAQTPHAFRRPLSSSTAIKRPLQSAAQTSMCTASPMKSKNQTMLQRTRSDMGLTPKAKKRAREVLKMEDTTLSVPSINISDCSLSLIEYQEELEKDKQLMPPPSAGMRGQAPPGQKKVIYGSDSRLHSTALESALEPVFVPPPAASRRCQLFTCPSSSIEEEAEEEEDTLAEMPTISNRQKALSGIQPLEPSPPKPNPPRVLRRSTRLMSIQSIQESNTTQRLNKTEQLRRSVRLGQLKEEPARDSNKTKSMVKAMDLIPTVVVGTGEAKKKTKKEKSSWLDNHRKDFLNLLNNGSVKELKKLPGIGPKTAASLATYRYVVGSFKDLGQVQELPIWAGNKWHNVCIANCLES